MRERNFRMDIGDNRLRRWRGSREFLHAEPRQTTGNANLAVKAGQTRMSK
jgi:hypothetical protein